MKWIVDTGGMPFGRDSEDGTAFTGIETQLYYFEPAMSREELTEFFADINSNHRINRFYMVY